MNPFRQIAQFIDQVHPFVAAVVLRTDGSAPQKPGARAVIDGNGRIYGTIGGGPVEAEAQRRAIEACRSMRPIVFDFAMQGAGAESPDAICGGSMRILLDPTTAKDRAAYAQAAEALRRRERGVLLAIARGGAETTARWMPENAIALHAGFPGAEAIRSCLVREAPQLFVEDSDDPRSRAEILVEPVVPQPRLLIVGGGHVGQALARAAAFIGFNITVLDDRPEFSDPALFPDGVATRCGDVAKEVAAFPMARDIFVVIVTRAHQRDAEALQACIHSAAGYIGMIGSRRKVALMRRDFVESGRATAEEFDRVHAPIGLEIGALTVPEIALSIAAELIAVRRMRKPE
ncbi:MAG: XdhC family protein [Candidatus Sumerlaeota bacterium]|nr:XdhC family protein [Candidatus Sumerlaeota bacterium]